MDPEDLTDTPDAADRTGPTLGVVAAVGSWPRDVAVVERAVQEADLRDGTVTLLHVDQERYAMTGADEEYVGRHVAAEHEVLAAAAGHARSLRRRAPVQTALYVGSVTDGILRTAHAAAVVVLGAEGASPAVRAVRGGVTAAVVARATCLVEVVPAGERLPGPDAPPVARVVAASTAAGQRSVLADVATAQAAVWDVPVEEVTLPGRPGTELPGLDEHDLVVVLRGTHAPLWGRPDARLRGLLDHAPCSVLVAPPEVAGAEVQRSTRLTATRPDRRS